MWRVTYHMVEENGRPFDVIGTGPSQVAAQAEADTKLALTVGTLGDSLSSGPVAVPGAPNANATYSDAVLVLKKGAGATLITTPIQLQNISNEYGVDGEIDITSPAIIAFASAYRDGAGNGGYSPKSGRYVR